MTTQDPVNLNASPNPSKDPGKLKILDVLGPGLITGASDDDPSGIATYSQIGAQFGYTMNWTLIFSYPLMVAIQIISGRLGRTTGRGVAGNLRKFYSNWLVYSAVPLLLVANVINIGADIGAMGDATKLVIGGPSLLYALAFGVACAAAQVFFDYNKYARILKWLSLALLTYVATLFVVKIDWRGFGFGLVVPHLEFSKELLTAVVAVFGTTISPYLFFWQASQEVEEIEDNADRERLKDAPEQAHSANMRINLDTFAGMAVSNVIALAIMVTAAATLHTHNVTTINSSADAAKALEPVAGKFAEVLFVLGILGTGLLAVPVLAGSAAYGLGEAFKWPTGLAKKPREAKAFYTAITLATLIGASIVFTGVNPIDALFWSAVVNGVVAVPIMVLMMLMATSARVMGDHRIGRTLQIFGWLSTAVMALCALGMFASFAL
ncbi:iron transporter [Labrys miyagiensis]